MTVNDETARSKSSDGPFQFFSIKSAMKSDEQIAAELQQAAEGLLWMSESDYPFEVVRWEKIDEVSADFLRHFAGQPPDAPVALENRDDFFRNAITEREGQREVDRQTAEKYRRLLQVLETNLRDISVYKVGRINIAVYVMGRTPMDCYLGLSTRVVET